MVSQAYARERADLRSAASLATGDKNAVSAITALEQSLGLSEPIDTARVQAACKLAASRLNVPVLETPVLTDAETAASKLIPSKKPGTTTQPSGPPAPRDPNAPPPPLAGYYAMEARNFADGTRSILEIRNALAAEFGPVAVDDVVRFFRDAEKAGTFTIATKTEPLRARRRNSPCLVLGAMCLVRGGAWSRRAQLQLRRVAELKFGLTARTLHVAPHLALSTHRTWHPARSTQHGQLLFVTGGDGTTGFGCGPCSLLWPLPNRTE